jgi:glycosyltransferase involved in cell wall biosynthesis
MSGQLRYAVVTPARDEIDNLARLAGCLEAQTAPPLSWVIVDNGSTDGTVELARGLERRLPWVRVLEIPGERDPVRGRPIVRALHAGIRALGPLPEIVVSVDADISFGPDYFARLLAAFAADPGLGIASGSGWELEGGEWRQRHLTGSTVWGASRAFRRECLEQVLPFEERLGWDGVDQFKANARGWNTRTLTDLPFHHHRPEGARGGAWRMRADQGRTAHFVGYRPSYLLIRALHQSIRHPAGLGLVWGYLAAAAGRGERLADPAAVAYVHSQQRLRDLPARAREALGRRAEPPDVARAAPRSAAG